MVWHTLRSQRVFLVLDFLIELMIEDRGSESDDFVRVRTTNVMGGATPVHLPYRHEQGLGFSSR